MGDGKTCIVDYQLSLGIVVYENRKTTLSHISDARWDSLLEIYGIDQSNELGALRNQHLG